MQNILLHEVIVRRKKMLDQLVEGLEEANFMKLLRLFPERMKSLLVPCKENELNPAKLLKLIEPYSEFGSEEEEKTFAWLTEYVKNLGKEGNYNNNCYSCDNYNYYFQDAKISYDSALVLQQSHQ